MRGADPFAALRAATRARIGLGRAGDGLPTRARLDLQMAHAMARDAVHAAVDFDGLSQALAPRETIRVASAAPDRRTYLRRPDLGRKLARGEAEKLPAGPFDLVFVVADGLSSQAVAAHAASVIAQTETRLPGLRIGPVVLARQGRVALGDDIGAAMGARLLVMLIGERPGLSAADSLGAYLTFAPRPGTRDSARNCVSNIHEAGLPPPAGADKIAWLAREALRRGLTGVDLKEAAPALPPGAASSLSLSPPPQPQERPL